MVHFSALARARTTRLSSKQVRKRANAVFIDSTAVIERQTLEERNTLSRLPTPFEGTSGYWPAFNRNKSAILGHWFAGHSPLEFRGRRGRDLARFSWTCSGRCSRR